MKENAHSSFNRTIVSTGLLSAVALGLIFLSVAGAYFHWIMGKDTVHGLVPKFDLDKEGNIPTYFSAFLLFVSAVLLGIIATFKIKKREPFSIRWAALSLIFLLLSIDEFLNFHEKWVENLRYELTLTEFARFRLITGITLALLVGIFYLTFFWSLPIKTKALFFIAAILTLGGIIGVSAYGNHYADFYGVRNINYALITILEMSLKLLGGLTFIFALFSYLERNRQP